MAKENDLRPVFERLKKIFRQYERTMNVVQDTDTMYVLNTRYLLKKNYPLMFGGVRLGKNYVSYYLMPVYAAAEESRPMSPELQKRMQGKACFNFKSVDEPLFKELAQLTKTGAKRFNDEKYVEQLRHAQAAASQKRKQKRG